ncbi:MAG: hypothetical protein ACR2G7_06680 [Acidimicrobiales bacterium]
MVERETRTARFCLEGQPDRYRLAHPCLTAAASIFAWWDGRVALHAGGFVVDGTAWGLMGAQEAGKSTTMAWPAPAASTSGHRLPTGWRPSSTWRRCPLWRVRRSRHWSDLPGIIDSLVTASPARDGRPSTFARPWCRLP